MSEIMSNIPDHIKEEMGLTEHQVQQSENTSVEQSVQLAPQDVGQEHVHQVQQSESTPVEQPVQSAPQDVGQEHVHQSPNQQVYSQEFRNATSNVVSQQPFVPPVQPQQEQQVQQENPTPQPQQQEEVSQPQQDEFISETFSKLASGQQTIPTANIQPIHQPKMENPLDKIHIDVSNVEIIEKSPLQQVRDFEVIFSKKPTYQVVAVQSAYSAEMSAINLSEMIKISDSNVDLYTHKKNLYQVIHSHIENSSVGKIGFTDWLKITSFHDLETLLYGIYCQTFPEKNEFDITCPSPSCGKKTTVIINNETLVETHNEGIVLDKIREIISSTTSPTELIGKSLVHTTERLILPNTKLLIDIHTPSLWDHLELIRTLDPRVLEHNADAVSTMLFVKNMFMLDVEGTLQTGKPRYYPIKDRNRILDILIKLDKDDGLALQKGIYDRIQKYEISYSIKNAKCMHCHDSLGTIPVSIEHVLFTRIYETLRRD